VNRYERQVQRLLLAYPAGWRDERGEEMVGTILDLAGDRRRWVAPRVALDLLIGGWTERARRHLRGVGPLAAGWRLAIGIAIVAQLVVSVIWLRDWALTGTPAVLAGTIAGASAVTYGLALAGFAVGAVAWLAGARQVARLASRVAITAWVLTVVVFHAMSNPFWMSWLEVVVWTYLAAIAALGLSQPPPTNRRVAGAVTLVVLAASQVLTTGVVPMSNVAFLVLREQPFPVWLFDRGPDTLHTALRSGWTLYAIVGLALVRIDPRHAVAACWLFPFLALNHLYWGGPLGLTAGVLAGTAVVAWALATLRSPTSRGGRGRSGDEGTPSPG
jgi:hypothetical protein